MENINIKRINIGCGTTPTSGWFNFDNSYSVKLGDMPLIISLLLDKVGVINQAQLDYIRFIKENKIQIQFADATSRIPFKDNTVSVVYSSHMIEHLPLEDAKLFLKEVRRVLVPEGIIRISVPDLAKLINQYNIEQDAYKFILKTRLGRLQSKGLLEKFKFLLFGDRGHLWMYDGRSLCQLLESCGYYKPTVMEPGNTKIENPGKLNLYEREDESVYVEALNPNTG